MITAPKTEVPQGKNCNAKIVGIIRFYTTLRGKVIRFLHIPLGFGDVRPSRKELHLWPPIFSIGRGEGFVGADFFHRPLLRT